jgi:hypothetical protein
MSDARRFANLVMLLAAIAAGIVFGVWAFDAITG